jgi:hydrogenase-4 component B
MQTLFIIMLSAYSIGVVISLTGIRGNLGRGLTALSAIIGAGAGFILGVSVILSGVPFTLSIPELLPLAGGLSLRLDSLSAFFLILIAVGAIPAVIYGVGYSEKYEDGSASLRMLGVTLNLFLLSMSLVTLANNVLTFLLMWEGMSLTSYFLVMTESNSDDTVQAGVWYAAMTHAGLALLLAMFILLMNGGSGAFSDLSASAATLSATTRNLIFTLALLGFGSKSGLIPLHVWLPRAYSAAPGYIAAMMSGIMSKMGVYGFLRITIDLLGVGPRWWGTLVIAVGATTAIIGILYALMENDLTRLVAYSSIENLGLIFIGAGAGLLYLSSGSPAAAALALIATLYHILNHSAFKGALFMGAGAVYSATGTRDMNQMGGLIKKMPWTSLFFLVCSIAISGIPPLNGFVSEWLLFQALLPGVGNAQPVSAAVVTVAIGLLALIGGLAAAGFVKAFGITFLALPRSDESARATEVPLTMRIGMGWLTLTCIILGLAPTVIVPLLARSVSALNGLSATLPSYTFNVSLQMPDHFAVISPMLTMLGLLLVLGLIPLVMFILRVNWRLRLSDSWGCGRVGQTSRMEYTATAFAEPLRRVFAELYRPTKELTVDFHPESKYFVQSIEYRAEIRSWFEEFLYNPLVAVMRWLSYYMRKLQSGSVHGYMAYLFVILALMLASLLLPGQ